MRRVLFLCTGNCVRSQMAEALLRHRGAGRFEVFSAGSQPAGFVHPMALQVLAELQVPTRELRSKFWKEFEQENFDAVITLCSSARGEICPFMPLPEHGVLPARVHWGFEDPSEAEVMGVEARLEEFRRVRDEIRACVEHLALASKKVLDSDEAFAGLVREIASEAPGP